MIGDARGLFVSLSFIVAGCAGEPAVPAPIQPSPGECVVHLELKGMSNPDRCPRMIGDAVQEVDGVRHVTVGYLERMGWVRAVEGSLCTPSRAERLVQAIRRMGYDGRVQRIVRMGEKP